MAQPDLIITPFGENAAPGTIETIPETLGPGDLPQQASWNAGFPSVTMTPLAAGGIPPRGQDFNGVLKAISEHTVFVGGGGQYKWDAAFAADNGYPLGAVLQKTGNDGFWLNLLEGNTTDPDAGGADWIDASSTTLPYALDTGATNAYVATYAPALSEPATGQVVRFKASNANTGASTFNPNGLGAKPIVSVSGAPLSVGSIQANGHVWLQYDAAIGGGSWVNLLSTGADTLNAPIATVAAASTVNLTAGAPSTSQVVISGTGVTINNFTVAANRAFLWRFSGANTLVNSASIVTNTGKNIFTSAGDSCWVRSTAANTVEILCYMPGGSWEASLVDNGYAELPNGLILQWIKTSSSGSSSGSLITLPVTFPNGVLAVAPVDQTTTGSINLGAIAWSPTQSTNSQIMVVVASGNNVFGLIALGW